MSLFQCSKCGCIENTALTTGYWHLRFLEYERNHECTEKVLAEVKEYQEKLGLTPDQPLGLYCCVCTPIEGDKLNGEMGVWHNVFPRNFYPLGSMVTDREGNIKSKQEMQESANRTYKQKSPLKKKTHIVNKERSRKHEKKLKRGQDRKK